MNFKKSDELLLIIENDADKIISRTKTRAAESVFGILIKSIDIFHSNTKLLLQELMNLIGVTENEASIFYFIITDQNKTFEIYKPGYWQDPNTKFKKLGELEEQARSYHNKLDAEEINNRELEIEVKIENFSVIRR